jgi:hypothetical protein
MNTLAPEDRVKIFNQRWAGKRFGLLVVQYFYKDRGNTKDYLCLCDCGEERITSLYSLRHGGTDRCKACTALKVSLTRQKIATRDSKAGIFRNTKKHGDCHTTFYQCWAGMKNRCNKPPHNCYEHVRYCKEWEDYESFKRDMFSTYFKYAVLDRIDPAEGYNKDNCQWMTKSAHGHKTREDNRSKI